MYSSNVFWLIIRMSDFFQSAFLSSLILALTFCYSILHSYWSTYIGTTAQRTGLDYGRTTHVTWQKPSWGSDLSSSTTPCHTANQSVAQCTTPSASIEGWEVWHLSHIWVDWWYFLLEVFQWSVDISTGIWLNFVHLERCTQGIHVSPLTYLLIICRSMSGQMRAVLFRFVFLLLPFLHLWF